MECPVEILTNSDTLTITNVRLSLRLHKCMLILISLDNNLPKTSNARSPNRWRLFRHHGHGSEILVTATNENAISAVPVFTPRAPFRTFQNTTSPWHTLASLQADWIFIQHELLFFFSWEEFIFLNGSGGLPELSTIRDYNKADIESDAKHRRNHVSNSRTTVAFLHCHCLARKRKPMAQSS